MTMNITIVGIFRCSQTGLKDLFCTTCAPFPPSPPSHPGPFLLACIFLPKHQFKPGISAQRYLQAKSQVSVTQRVHRCLPEQSWKRAREYPGATSS